MLPKSLVAAAVAVDLRPKSPLLAAQEWAKSAQQMPCKAKNSAVAHALNKTAKNVQIV